MPMSSLGAAARAAAAMPLVRRVALLALALGASAAPWLRPVALAQGAAAAPIRLELNRLEPREAGCRVWMVLNNAGTEMLDPLRLDLVLFGRDGTVARRLAVDVGPLPGGRTVVRLFDVAGQPCEGLGQFLLNDVLACGSAGTGPEARSACTDRTVLASRPEGVPFLK
jgi:hypothetical protein